MFDFAVGNPRVQGEKGSRSNGTYLNANKLGKTGVRVDFPKAATGSGIYFGKTGVRVHFPLPRKVFSDPSFR